MNIAPQVLVKFVRNGAIMPRFMSEGSAGADLSACIEDNVCLKPGDFEMIPTGLALSIPDGFEGEIRPRSGLAARYGVTLLNSPGTIDSDYRGEINVILINHGKKDFSINNGDRIAQLLIKPVNRLKYIQVEELPDTDRGNAGFGSTGI